MKNLMIEAFMVGLLIIPIGLFVLYLSYLAQNNLKIYRDLGPNIRMVIGFFVLGFITHLACEYSGINRWYCKNGNACR